MSQPQPQLSADGRFYFDGQSWKPMPTVNPAPVSRVQGVILFVGAALVVAGSFLPWVTATAPFVGTISRSLMDVGSDGIVLDALGGVVLLIALAITVRGPMRLGSLVAILVLMLAAGLVVIDYNKMQSGVASATTASNLIIASVGPGPYVSGFGVLTGAIGSAMALFGHVGVRATRQPIPGLAVPPASSAPYVSIDTSRPKMQSHPPVEAGSKLGAHSSDGAWYWNGEQWLPSS